MLKIGNERSTIYKVEALVMPGFRDDFVMGVPFLAINDAEIDLLPVCFELTGLIIK